LFHHHQSLVSAAPASKTLDESVFENAGTPTWKIAVVKGEAPVEFKGTIQDVMEQLKVDYPEYARKAQEKIDAAIKAEEESGVDEPPSPEAQALDRLQALLELPCREGEAYPHGHSVFARHFWWPDRSRRSRSLRQNQLQ
jgi:hypothetical protein